MGEYNVSNFTANGWRKSQGPRIERFLEALNAVYKESYSLEDLFEGICPAFDASSNEQIDNENFLKTIWIYFSTNLYDACQGMTTLHWEEAVNLAGSETLVYRQILIDLFHNRLLVEPPGIDSSYVDGFGEEVEFTWAGVDYSWSFPVGEEVVDTRVFTQFFELMERTTKTRWRYDFIHTDHTVCYGAIPLSLAMLIDEHFSSV